MQEVNCMIVSQGPFHDTVFATELKINGAEHKSKGRANCQRRMHPSTSCPTDLLDGQQYYDML